MWETTYSIVFFSPILFPSSPSPPFRLLLFPHVVPVYRHSFNLDTTQEKVHDICLTFGHCCCLIWSTVLAYSIVLLFRHGCASLYVPHCIPICCWAS